MFNLRELFNYEGNSTLGTFCSISTIIEMMSTFIDNIWAKKKKEEQKTTQRELKLSFLQLQ